MTQPRYNTLEAIAQVHPEISERAFGDAQVCCQPSGTDSEGNVLFRSDMVVLAARLLSGDDPFCQPAGKSGLRGVTYR